MLIDRTNIFLLTSNFIYPLSKKPIINISTNLPKHS